MSKLNEIVFKESLPKLDLHGFDRDSARVAINDFIHDNHVMQNELLLIVHGIGSGIIKKETHQTLKQNPLVVDYKTDYFNEGCTIVEIKT